MSKLKNLEKLPGGVRKKISPYMEGLLKAHGENIISIFIYGSAASGDFIPGVSGINSAVVFNDLKFEQLKKSLHQVGSGIRKQIVAPLFITREYIKTSCDTFPLEFLEMKENHLIIYGKDLLQDLEVRTDHIRFVCEEQLKGKLIRIRQAYLEIGLRKKGMEALVKESLDSLFPVFKGLLRLKGVAPPSKKEEAARLLTKTFGINGDVFIAVLQDKEIDEKIGSEDMESFLEKYIEQIRQLTYIADQL
jgi:hypothetical protein